MSEADTNKVAVEQPVVTPEPAVAPVADLEAEKRSGVKETAQNADVMAIEQGMAEQAKEAEKPLASPSFFVKKDARNTIEVDVLTSGEDGRIVSVSRVGLNIDFDNDFPFMKHTVLKFIFSQPNYEDMSTYRRRSGVYRREAQQVIVDKIELRNHLLIWHLKDWNLTDSDGKKIELKSNENGALSDESEAIVYALSPTLLDVVMTIFEKDSLLS
jgi:hypothetical protein